MVSCFLYATQYPCRIIADIRGGNRKPSRLVPLKEVVVDFETIKLEKQDGIAVLTLNRPHRHNAISGAMTRELPKAWADIKADPNVVVVIVTGAGERALCTGIDVGEVAAGGAQVGEPDKAGTLESVMFTAIHNKCWKPVITAVNGMVVGGGLHFIADSDIIICSDNATFFDTHVKVGLVSAQEPVGLTRRIPLETVLRMSLMGGAERMSAQRAYEIGLVSQVVPFKDLMPTAKDIAKKIMGNSPAAMMRTKRAIWEGLDYGLDKALEHAWDIISSHRGHPDSKEGAMAFAQKRQPSWQKT